MLSSSRLPQLAMMSLKLKLKRSRPECRRPERIGSRNKHRRTSVIQVQRHYPCTIHEKHIKNCFKVNSNVGYKGTYTHSRWSLIHACCVIDRRNSSPGKDFKYEPANRKYETYSPNAAKRNIEHQLLSRKELRHIAASTRETCTW